VSTNDVVTAEDKDRLEQKLRVLGYGVGEYAYPLDYFCDDMEVFLFVEGLVDKIGNW